jgi:hypothetical protein
LWSEQSFNAACIKLDFWKKCLTVTNNQKELKLTASFQLRINIIKFRLPSMSDDLEAPTINAIHKLEWGNLPHPAEIHQP